MDTLHALLRDSLPDSFFPPPLPVAALDGYTVTSLTSLQVSRAWLSQGTFLSQPWQVISITVQVAMRRSCMRNLRRGATPAWVGVVSCVGDRVCTSSSFCCRAGNPCPQPCRELGACVQTARAHGANCHRSTCSSTCVREVHSWFKYSILLSALVLRMYTTVWDCTNMAITSPPGSTPVFFLNHIHHASNVTGLSLCTLLPCHL